MGSDSHRRVADVADPTITAVRATARRAACLLLMNAVRTGQRLTTGAAIAGLVAAVLAGGAPEVFEARKVPVVKVATKTPPTVANSTPEKRCFDALRPVLAKPAWKVTIERGEVDCLGSR